MSRIFLVSAGGVSFTLAASMMQPVQAQALVNGKACTGPTDSIAYDTCGYPASDLNYSRTFSSLVIHSTDSSGVIGLTAIPALAGAVASIKIGGVEIIATGSHGSSFQFDLHNAYTTPLLPASECDNPTEAGSQIDSAPAADSPWLSSSSTYIQSYWSGLAAGNLPQIAIQSNMAYWIPQDVQPSEGGNCASYWAQNGGFVSGTQSGFILTKWMTLGMTVNGLYYPTVLQVDSQVTSPRAVQALDLDLPMYLQNTMTQEIFYNPKTNTQFIKTPGQANGTVPFNNGSVAPTIRIFSNSAGTYAVGIIVPPWYADPKQSAPALLYTTTNLDLPPGSTYPWVYRIIASTYNYSGVASGTTLTAHSYFAFGSVALIEAIGVSFCKQWSQC